VDAGENVEELVIPRVLERKWNHRDLKLRGRMPRKERALSVIL
jgi:hypothetical protein